MIDSSILGNLVLDFTEKILNIDVQAMYEDKDLYYNAIVDIAKYLKIGKITLVYEDTQSYIALFLQDSQIYTNGLNVLYDSFEVCDSSQTVSFSYSQNDGNYTLNFIQMANEKPWDDEVLTQLKLISNLSFNVLSRIKLLEVSQLGEYYDYATGVLNTNGIVTSLDTLYKMDLVANYFCAHVNIKHFKSFNLKYTYNGGDIILREFAEQMYSNLKENELFGHLGEDNFIAVVKKANKKEFLENIKNIRLEYNNDIIQLKLYVGIYDICHDDDSSVVLSNCATALNIARNSPAMQYVTFTEEMHRQALEIKHIEDVMHQALENNEFITFYQPKICLTDFSLVGAEALVRWKKGDVLIPPFKFIPIFEKNGFITEIDFCMLRNVCKSIKKWEDMGLNPVTVSVNFSKVHLGNRNFVSQIKDTIDSYGISPKYIEIEFTETLDVENYNSLVKVNRELKQWGLKTSIDDFGAGFSSLNMLKDVPVDVVKLDKSLIDDTNSSTREKIIIQDIVKMAKTLDIEVIAEGVEELDQLLFLKNINCTQIQGYIFDKPLSIEEFEKRLSNREYYKENPKFKDVVHNNDDSHKSISAMNFGKYTLDLNNYKILDCNDSFSNIVGYSKEEIINNNFTIENFILYEEVSDYLDRIVSNLIAHGEVCQEHKMIRKNGNKIYVMCLGVVKSSGQADFMVSDISINKVVERENKVLRSNFDFAQKELKNKSYMFEQIVNSLSGGIGVFALQKDNTIKTIFASNSFYNIIQCKRSIFDRYKNNILKLIVPEEVDTFLNDFKECIEQDKEILKRYNFKSIQNNDEHNALNLKMQSTGNVYDGCPTVNVVVAKYNIGNVEMELINEIAKVSLLTEYSNLDIMNLPKDSIDV